MNGQYNLRNPAVKRLMKEAQELHEPTEQYHAQPLEDNLFEWHFTIRGPAESDFDGGLYHGRIVLPPEYPMKPPSIILLTPNGRFEILKKICLSISGHHPESWQPSWSIRTALLAIIGFMPTHGAGAIGSLDYTPEERKVLVRKSKSWKCQNCGSLDNVLKPVTEASEKTNQEAKELATQINFQAEKEKPKTNTVKEKQSSMCPESVKEETSPPHTSAQPSPMKSPQNITSPGVPPFPQFPFFPNYSNSVNTNGLTNRRIPRFPYPPTRHPYWSPENASQVASFPAGCPSSFYPGCFPLFPNFTMPGQAMSGSSNLTSQSTVSTAMPTFQTPSSVSSQSGTSPHIPVSSPGQSTSSPSPQQSTQSQTPSQPHTDSDAQQQGSVDETQRRQHARNTVRHIEFGPSFFFMIILGISLLMINIHIFNRISSGI